MSDIHPFESSGSRFNYNFKGKNDVFVLVKFWGNDANNDANVPRWREYCTQYFKKIQFPLKFEKQVMLVYSLFVHFPQSSPPNRVSEVLVYIHYRNFTPLLVIELCMHALGASQYILGKKIYCN